MLLQPKVVGPTKLFFKATRDEDKQTQAQKMAGEQEYDVLLKVLMIGDSDVGKSSILLRFTDDLYNDEQPVTIGIYFIIIHDFISLLSKFITSIC